MNGEKFSPAEADLVFLETIQKPLDDLSATHESEKVVVKAIRDALEAEGVVDTYNDLLVEAESIEAYIEKIIPEVLQGQSGPAGVSEEQKASLGLVRAEIGRHQNVKNKLLSVLDSYGYEVTIAGVSVEVPETVPEVLPEAAVQGEVSVVSEPVPAEAPADPVAEVSPAAVESAPSAPEQKPASLRELYAVANTKALRVYSEERGKDVFKKLSVIVAEVRTVLTEAGFAAARIDLFSNEVLNRICFDIKTLNQKKASEPDRNEHNKINRDIQAKYQELLQEVAGFLQTEPVDQAEGLTHEGLPQPSHEDVNEQLETLLAEYGTIKEKIIDPELKKRIEALVETIARYSETDVVRQTLDKSKYIEKLRGYLAEVREGGVENELVPSAEPLIVPVSAEPATTETEMTPLPEPEVVPVPEPLPIPEAYEKKYEEHFAIKAEYKEKEKAYKEALHQFYQSDDTVDRVRLGTHNTLQFLGLRGALPEHLQVLQSEYKQARSLYAQSLDGALRARSSTAGNREYSSGSNKTKAAFGTKFILKPGQEFLALQEQTYLSPEAKAKLQSTLAFLAKHKWTTRAGLVTMAGVAGALSGGLTLALTGAAFQASKIALSMGAGSLAGYGVSHFTKSGVSAAQEGLAKATKEVTGQFTLTDLDALEQAMEEARTTKARVERHQKVLTVGAGVLAGGITGFSLSADAAAETAVTYKNTPENATLTPPKINPEALDSFKNEINPGPVPVEKNTAVEVSALPFELPQIAVPYEGLDNTKLSYQTVLSDIKLTGTFNASTFTIAERGEIEAFLKLKANDLLSARFNISEANLEAALFEKLQGKYSTATWWDKANITAVDIGSMEVRPVATGMAEVLPASEATIIKGSSYDVIEEEGPADTKVTVDGKSYTEGAQSAPAPEKYVVVKGDTLYEIAEKQFAAELRHLPPAERNEILARLMEKIEQKPEIKDSLGIRSGDIDLIYPNETIALQGMRTELENLLERREIIELFKTGPLPVEADGEVKDVPITVTEKPVSAGVIVEDRGKSYLEGTATGESRNLSADVQQPEVVPPPRPSAPNGQYTEQPAYRDYIQKMFGPGKAYELAVERAVQKFDSDTYDVFENSAFFGGNTYESPYRLLSEMTLKEVAAFESQPNSEIRAFLTEKNIKYDTYLAWLDKIDEMSKTLPNQPETKVFDLFSRYVVEVEMPKGKVFVT